MLKYSSLKAFFYYFVHFTWGLSVNLAGGLIYLILRITDKSSERFKNSIITYTDAGNFGGFSLGIFIFINKKREEGRLSETKIHEYGHTIQALILGPFYWIAVALPSAVWAQFFQGFRKRRNIPYSWLYCESWADKWGKRYGMI